MVEKSVATSFKALTRVRRGTLVWAVWPWTPGLVDMSAVSAGAPAGRCVQRACRLRGVALRLPW